MEWSDTEDDTEPLGSESEEEEEDIEEEEEEELKSGGATLRGGDLPGFTSARVLLNSISGQYPQSCTPSSAMQMCGHSLQPQPGSTSIRITPMTQSSARLPVHALGFLF